MNIIFFGVLAFLAFVIFIYFPYLIISWLLFDSDSNKQKLFGLLVAVVFLPTIALPIPVIWMAISLYNGEVTDQIADIMLGLGIVSLIINEPLRQYGLRNKLFPNS